MSVTMTLRLLAYWTAFGVVFVVLFPAFWAFPHWGAQYVQDSLGAFPHLGAQYVQDSDEGSADGDEAFESADTDDTDDGYDSEE